MVNLFSCFETFAWRENNVTVQGETFARGVAAADNNNCLIHTLGQLVLGEGRYDQSTKLAKMMAKMATKLAKMATKLAKMMAPPCQFDSGTKCVVLV